MIEVLDVNMVSAIKELIEQSRKRVAHEVNVTLLKTYYEIGKVIIEYENSTDNPMSIRVLSKVLTEEYGKGFSKSNLNNMRLLYMNYESVQSLTGQLSWTHYCELLNISDKNKRNFYEKEAINSRWSVKELRRQINSSLFERLLLSNGEINK